MMKVIVFVAMLAYAAADCDVLDQIKVKMQWSQAYNEGLSREAFGQAIWRAFFAQAPNARGLFDRVNGDNLLSPEFQAHSMRVLGGIDMCFSLLDDSDVFESALSHLNDQHRERGLRGEYFKLLGNAIIQSARASVGTCFDQDVWEACFNEVSRRIL